MSAIRLPLSVGLYSRKQGDIQTSDCQTADIRHTLFPNARGFRRLRRPGSRRRRGFAPGRLGFCPQSGPVQRKLCMLPAAAPHERKRTQPFYTTCREAAPPFYICGASRHHNPRAEGPSNFRTLRTFGPLGPSILSSAGTVNFLHVPLVSADPIHSIPLPERKASYFPWPFCRRRSAYPHLP